MVVPTMQVDHAQIEASLLGVLLEAETAREGATALLAALAPAIDAGNEANSVALAVRDRDNVTLHVLAELGAPRSWPASLEPRFSLGAQSGVDKSSGAVVLPLRANGRVIGALLIVDAIQASAMQKDPAVMSLFNTLAAVLDALVARTDAALRRRSKAQRSVEAVLEGIAHQIANPLTGASAIAELLAEEIQDEGQRAAVKQIKFELGRASTVLRDLLDFRRQTGAHAGILDLNGVVEGVTRFRGYAIREQGISLTVETLAQPAQVRQDAHHLEQALLICLRHAELQSQASVNRSVIVRVVDRSGAEVAVEITDSGPGTVPDLTSSYFDLHFRDELERAHLPEKPDLGLANSILRSAGGRLEVRGSKSEGTTLSLVLPRSSTGSQPMATLSRPQ
jgi:signal transduction histidine kinase